MENTGKKRVLEYSTEDSKHRFIILILFICLISDFFRKSDIEELGKADYLLGLSFWKNKQIELCLPFFEIAAEIGYIAAFLRLFIIYEQTKFKNSLKAQKYKELVSKHIEWFQNQANTGDSYSQFNLGLCFYFGVGITQDLKEAVFWYRKAAQGDEYAQFNLGRCYQNGDGVDVDLKEAIYW